MAHAPATLLQGLVDAALDLCGAESAGISIEEVGDGEPVFRWHAIAGRLANFVGTTLPRYFSPCGDVLARESALLMADPVRHYPYIDSLGMPFREVLLIPFRRGEKPVGTIWVVAHGDQRQFDAEDLRLASNLADLAGAAWGLVSALDAATAARDQLLAANAALAGQQAVMERHLAERAQTERLWRESEERLRLATEAADVGIWDFDPATGTLIWDTGVKRHFGLPPDAQIAGYQTFLAGLHPDDRARVDAAVQAALQPGGQDYDIVYRTVGLEDRQERHIAARGRALYDERGVVVRFIGTTTDISAQHAAAEQARFFNELAREIGGISDPNAVMGATTRALGLHFEVARCAYADVEPDEDAFTIKQDWSPHLPSSSGAYRLNAFGAHVAAGLRAGRTLVVSDVTAEMADDPGRAAFLALKIRGIICCPLVKNGRLVAMMAIHATSPRQWRPAEIALMQETTERSWAHLERARSEAELRESEERYRLIGDVVNDAIWDWDLSTNAVRWNRGLASAFGYADVGSRTDAGWWLSRLHPDDRDPVERSVYAAFGSGQDTFQQEYRFRRADGSYAFVSDRAWIVRDKQGLPVRMVGSMQDVTERRRAERAAVGTRFLANASATLSELVDYESTLRRIANLAVESFADWCFVDIIEGEQRRRLDVSKAEAPHVRAARAVDSTYPPLDADLYGVTQVLRTGQPEMVTDVSDQLLRQQAQDADHLRLLRARGVRSYICVPLLVRGQVLGSITFFVVDSDRRYTTDDLGVATALAARISVAIDNARLFRGLQESDQRKSEFLATLGHELRNPLAPLRTGLEVLKRAPDADTAMRVREVMDRQLAHMVRLIDDLLDIARLSQGKLELKMRVVTMAEVIRDAVDASRPLVDAAKHHLSVSLDDPSMTVHADPTRLSQIVANLLTNAAKYTPEGGAIDLSVTSHDGNVVVRVSDNGVGLSREHLSAIFDMFAQVGHHLHRAQGGLGIGLTLVKRLTDMHGGTVAAQSAGENRGSTFVVRLPIRIEASASEAVGPDASATSATAARLKVLVVDDNADSAEMIATLIRALGHDVRAAFSGADALSEAAAYAPDVVFLDIGLPGMSGYDVAARLRAAPSTSSATLVALTGWSTDEHMHRSRAAGFDRHLTKPVDVDDIEQMLRKN
jgi:PAS domain S-box-containing protein